MDEQRKSGSPHSDNLVTFSKAKSKVWDYFGFKSTDDGVDRSHAICMTCGTGIKHCGNTTNMDSHLRKWHPDLHHVLHPELPLQTRSTRRPVSLGHGNSVMPIVYKDVDSSDVKPSQQGTSSKPTPKFDPFTPALMNFLLKDLHSVMLLESDNFVKFVKILQPNYDLPSGETFSNNILLEKYREMSDRVKQELSSPIGSIAISIDEWKSMSDKKYITLACHFVDEVWKFKSFNLNTFPICDEDDMLKHLTKCLVYWGLNSKNVTIVRRSEEKHGDDKKEISLFGSTVPELPCLGQILNSAIKNVLEVNDVSAVIDKVRTLVRFFPDKVKLVNDFRSSTASGMSVDACDQEWLKIYDVLEKYATHEEIITTAIQENDDVDNDYLLSIKENATINKLMELLKPVRLATVALSEKKVPTISMMLPMIYQITKSFYSLTEDPLTKQIMKVFLTALKNSAAYWIKDVHDVLCFGSLLDPRFKSMFFLNEQEKKNINMAMTNELKIIATQRRVKAEPQDNSYEGGDNSPNSASNDGSCPKRRRIDDSPSKPKEAFAMFFEDLCNPRKETKSPTESASHEMYKYLAEENIGINDDPLMWWQARSSTYPLLSELAQKYLGIPSMCIEADKLFSETGLAWTQKRSMLPEYLLDQTLFLSANL